MAPKDYEKCKELKARKLYFIAPCGIDIGNKPGSNYTPPKKKRRSKRK